MDVITMNNVSTYMTHTTPMVYIATLECSEGISCAERIINRVCDQNGGYVFGGHMSYNTLASE